MAQIHQSCLYRVTVLGTYHKYITRRRRTVQHCTLYTVLLLVYGWLLACSELAYKSLESGSRDLQYFDQNSVGRGTKSTGTSSICRSAILKQNRLFMVLIKIKMKGRGVELKRSFLDFDILGLSACIVLDLKIIGSEIKFWSSLFKFQI